MDLNNEDTKSYVPDEQVSELRGIVNLVSELNECYDVTALIQMMHDALGPICKAINIKSVQCELVPVNGDEIAGNATQSFTLYETDGPEFDSIMYECPLPSGEKVNCCLSFMDFYPEDIKITKGKFLTQMICLYLSRARLGTSLNEYINKDPDTGLPNMQAFLDYGDRLFNDFKIANYTVVALNISNFKYVNQTVPFEVGTNVLVKYAHKLFSLIGNSGIVTRFGGDNFNILIEKERVEDFINAVRVIPIDIKDGNLRVHFELTSYVGIYDITSRTSIQVALENASDAKAMAKNMTHTYYVYYNEDMGEKQHHKNQVRASFTHAIEKHEFVAYYQPKVNMITQELIGMEALVRWETDGEVLRPSRFVGILEDTSSIIELDRNMLCQVCRDIKRWESMELNVPRISVNLSRRNLNNINIADEIAAVLDEYHVDHSKIEIEVTETVDNAEFNFLSEFIQKMQLHGISVSIDDFGTGYSSLNLLKSLKANVLKIDRSFIDLPKFTEQDELLVKNIITLATAYDMEVITEGVESERQLRFLHKCGCENVQGYFFDMPMSKKDVTEVIRKGRYNKTYDLEGEY